MPLFSPRGQAPQNPTNNEDDDNDIYENRRNRGSVTQTPESLRHSQEGPQVEFYQNNNSHRRYLLPLGRPPTTPEEKENSRICVTLITTWLLMTASALFLAYYVYLLEWTPETTDPIYSFSLGFAVIMLYFMFIVDVCAGAGIVVSQKDFVVPFRFRIFWLAVGFLCLNHLHGTFVWLWVWTGELPRACARNSFYFGRKCPNLEMMTIGKGNADLSKAEITLDVSDCKCDYGQCLPECKGLRLIQNYFWGTYWLYLLRTVCLLLCFKRGRRGFCDFGWSWCPTMGRLRERRPRVSQLPPPCVVNIPINTNETSGAKCERNCDRNSHFVTNENQRRTITNAITVEE